MDVFRKHRIALRLLGIVLPGEFKSITVNVMIHIQFVVVITTLSSTAGLYFYWSVIFLHTDFMNRIVSLASAVSSVAAVAKLLVLKKHSRLLKDVLDSFCWFEADTSRGDRVAKVIRSYELAVLGIVISFNWKLGLDSKRPSPYWTEYPDGGPWIRDYSIYFLQCIFVLSTNVFVDTLFLFTTSQICHRLYLVNNTLSSVGSKTDEPENIPILIIEGDFSDENKISTSIEEHIKMLSYIKKLEWLFDEIIVFQALYSFITLCLIMFAVTQTDDIARDAIKLAAMLISLGVELFLFCWGGEMIKTHCGELHFAAYDNLWYETNRVVKTSLGVIQSFSCQPVQMKSAKQFELSLHTFETVVKETFSYYTIFYQFFNQK